MFPPSFPWKAYIRSIFFQSIVVVVAIAGTGLWVRYHFRRVFLAEVRAQVRSNLGNLLSEVSTTMSTDWCKRRLTGEGQLLQLIRTNGSFYCTTADAGIGADTSEVKIAQAKGFGDRVAEQPSVGSFYVAALRAENGWVVRLAVPLQRLNLAVRFLDSTLWLLSGLLMAILLATNLWTSQRLVLPLGRLLMRARALLREDTSRAEEFAETGYGEWIELESELEHVQKNLKRTTETLRKERVELETILSAISDAILAIDPEGTPLFYNSRFEMIFGAKGQLRQHAKLWSLFRDPEILEAFQSALGRTGAGVSQPSQNPVIQVQDPAGIQHHFSLSVSPLRRSQGEIYGAAGIFHDISSLKSAEKMRIDFVANVSHELRTPLTSIKGYVDTLLEDQKSGRALSPEFLAVIGRNTERLMNLMKDLLELSSLESGEGISREWIETREVTERVLGLFEKELGAKQQKLDREYLAAEVYADAHRVEQVLTNLVGNATKYAPAGSVIRVSWLESSGDILLRVFNSGPTIPEEHQRRLFERFYRVDKARSREQGGTGLGLAIVKHTMQLHHGTVTVENRPDPGVVFTCRFPSN